MKEGWRHRRRESGDEDPISAFRHLFTKTTKWTTSSGSDFLRPDTVTSSNSQLPSSRLEMHSVLSRPKTGWHFDTHFKTRHSHIVVDRAALRSPIVRKIERHSEVRGTRTSVTSPTQLSIPPTPLQPDKLRSLPLYSSPYLPESYTSNLYLSTSAMSSPHPQSRY